jgi:hypothetical protein
MTAFNFDPSLIH